MKRKRILAVVLLSCMISPYTMAADFNVDVSGNESRSLSLQSGSYTGHVTNSGTGSVSLSTSQGGTFTGSLKNLGGGSFTNKLKAFIGENNKLQNTKGTFTNANGGSITVQQGGTIENIDKLVNNGTITVSEGGTLQNSGDFISGGTLSNEGNFTNSGFFSGSFTNEGTVKNQKGGTVFLTQKTTTNSGDIENEGLFFVNKDATFSSSNGNFSNSGQFHNSGHYASATQLTNTGTFTNDGTFNGGLVNDGGTASNTGSGTMNSVVNQNGGLFSNTENARLTTAENKDGSTFKNQGIISGTVTNSSGSNFTNSGEVNGDITNDNAVFNNVDNGKLTKKFTNKNGGIFNNSSKESVSVDSNNATVNNSGNIGSVTLSNGAVVNNNKEGKLGSITGSDSTVNNSGTISGTIAGAIAEGGSSGLTVNNYKDGTISGIIKDMVTVNNDGTLDNANIQGGATVYNNIDGTVKGGTISGGANLYNDGTISDYLTVEKDGYLHLGANTQFDKDAKVDMSGHLDMMNGHFDDFRNNLGMMRPGTSVSVDISSATGQTDKLWAIRSVTLEDFNFIPDTLLSSGKITKEQLRKSMGLYSSSQLNIKEGVSHKALSPLRWLNATSSGDGISFAPTGSEYKDFNPAVMAGPVAAQLGGYLTQLNSYDEAFRNMDMYMLMTKKERQAMKLRNKYAAADGNLVFDPTNTPYDDTAAWIRPYATFENVRLKRGPKVSNVAYGSFFGGESQLYDLGKGWEGMYGVYAGYNGSHQAYDGVGIYQNGGTLGVVGMAYKGDFFTGLTLNAGANAGEADTAYGHDNFTLLMAGIANKTGYNWELADGKFIIQPSLMTSYSFVNTFDYKTSSGIDVNSDALHVVTFEPGVKFIGNMKNGWQPYAGVSVVWNILDKTDFYASDTTLPELSIKPFVKYGVGVRKTIGERLTGFFQTYITNGGRNGIGFQAGFRITLGKDGSAITRGKTPELAKTQVKLSAK